MSGGFSSRLREEFTANGARALVTAPLRVIRALRRTREVWFYTHPAKTAAPAAEAEELTAADWPRLSADATFPWRADASAQHRLTDGSQLFGWRDGAQLVSFAWVTVSSRFLVGELGGWVGFAQPVRWIWDCVTPEAHRGKGYYPQLLRALTALAGDAQPVIYCTRENVSSQRGVEKAGFVRSFTITERWPSASFRDEVRPLKFSYRRAA